ncbi:uncharacterized protein LOC119663875 [Teleopsis dalmanni]|uniref:uncharacterized protein LOC119663875 n=1 Tax=Teleopsis dalmanni TaxID=139649 RepID=UPI0018CCB8EE|nr:uncharacterized protein LOC119663875 [Teleopsis dalmanni]
MIMQQWNQLGYLHDELWENLENPLTSGFNQDEYYQIEDLVQQGLIELSIKLDQLQNKQAAVAETNMRSSLPLPKVTIPSFNGNYLKWRHFFDLFTQMVDNQPLLAAQKTWYFKSHVTGEAEKFISHFSITEENYPAAWTLLQDFYNNKRVLMSTLIDELLNQPSGISTVAAVKNLHDTTKECLLALNNLGVQTTFWDPILLQVLIKKLDRMMLIRYEQSLAKPKEIQNIQEFLAFLERQFQLMEVVEQKKKVAIKTEADRNKSVSSAVTVSKGNNNCKLCNVDRDPLYHCRTFLQFSPSQRLDWVKNQQLCFNCFKNDHVVNKCLSRSCTKCNKKHNTLLHLEGNNQTNQNIQPTSSGYNTAVTAATANTSTGQREYVFLPTARVKITTANGNIIEVRALLDSEGIGKVHKNSTQRVNIKLQSLNSRFTTEVEAFVLPNIVPPQPSSSYDISKWKVPNSIQLADPTFFQQGKIDILLGAEFYFSKITLAPGLPVLQNSTLGWIVSGKVASNTDTSNVLCAVFGGGMEAVDNNSSLEDAIERLWRMDEVNITERTLSKEEKLCESHFVQNVHTNKKGRFVVRLPFLKNSLTLGEFQETAWRRFISLERQLAKNDVLRKQYVQFMEEYERLGHMTEVNLDSMLTPRYFIPHHCVLKPDSTTTQLRVVFDASAKTTSGHSLNDLMYNGPTVQSELFSILLRFRRPRFVFTTDIEKMYRQVFINPEDRRYQLIIWRSSPNSTIRYYQLNTITYGTRAAPYLATRCLQKIASENKVNYPLGAQILCDNFYVDDGLGGSDSLITAIEAQRQLIHILKRYHFYLRKWSANHPQLLKNISQDDQEVNLDFDNNESIKTLGLFWLHKADLFRIRVKMVTEGIITKRVVSSDLARLFDSLGLVAPVIVKAKIFIQHLWQLKLSWDGPLPTDLRTTWSTFSENLSTLENLQVARHIFRGEVPSSTQLLIFTDASEKAFGSAAYLRAILKDGRIIVRLLCAKSRVAPLKKQTLPRLELCAAVLAAELSARVKSDLQEKDQPVFLWTDSEIVLSSINSQSSSFQTFVANKVARIQTLTLSEQWRYVRSKDNPAHWRPFFLHGRQEVWPPRFLSSLQVPLDLEKKKVVAVATQCNDADFIYRI